MGQYTCCVCGNSFYAAHKSAICSECKLTPSVCVICGKEFKRTNPYTQKTCSAVCRGKYRAESGIAKSGAAKMKQTKLDRYGSLDPSVVAVTKNGGITKRICPLCNKEFEPETVRQIYCGDKHYAPCPVCGEMTEIKDYSIGVQACSEKCRMARINATCLERYGNKDAVNSDHAKQLARKHSLEKYGKEYYMQTEEAKERVKQTMFEKYGVENALQSPEIRERIKATNLEKYGVEWAAQSEEVRNKIKQTNEELYGGMGLGSKEIGDRIRKTNQEKYGVSYPFESKEVQEKIHQNSMDKNGTFWPAVALEVNARRNQTNLEKYGATNVWGSKEIQEKIRKVWTEKYGGPSPMFDERLRKLAADRHDAAMLEKYGAKYTLQVPELKEKFSKSIQERYGVPWYVLTQECSEHNYKQVSKINTAFADCLNELGIKTRFEYHVGRPSFDIQLLDKNVLVEIDPTFTHNSLKAIHGDPIDKNYHVRKTQIAEEAGYRCIHVFDWDDWSTIIQLIVPKQTVYARKCKMMQIDKSTAEIFTNKNHMQGSCKGQDIVYGLYLEGELIEVMTFGKPRYNKNYDFELLRLCSRLDLNVVGGASRLFSAFKKDYPESSVLSYCDYSKFTGKVYEQIGMKLDHLTQPAKVWSKENEYVTDNLLRQHGFDRLFHANYGKGTSNEQLMIDNGWLPVYDCGQKVFVYIPDLSET